MKTYWGKELGITSNTYRWVKNKGSCRYLWYLWKSPYEGTGHLTTLFWHPISRNWSRMGEVACLYRFIEMIFTRQEEIWNFCVWWCRSKMRLKPGIIFYSALMIYEVLWIFHFERICIVYSKVSNKRTVYAY